MFYSYIIILFITTRKVIVASPDGGYEYKECEFVYVPNGNLKQSMVIYPITGDRSGQVLKVNGMQGKGVYVFDGYLVNERHCLSNGSLVKDSRISEEGLQYLSLVINEKRKINAEAELKKFYKRHGYNINEIDII